MSDSVSNSNTLVENHTILDDKKLFNVLSSIKTTSNDHCQKIEDITSSVSTEHHIANQENTLDKVDIDEEIESNDEHDFFRSLEKSVSQHVYFGETSSEDEDENNKYDVSDLDLVSNNDYSNTELCDRIRLCQTLLTKDESSRRKQPIVIERCPPTTVRVDSSDLITRCKDFIPLLTDSNKKLTEKASAGENVTIELDEEDNGPAIEMDLMFCPFGDKNNHDTDTSSSASSAPPSDHETKSIDLANIVKKKRKKGRNRKKKQKKRPTIIEIEQNDDNHQTSTANVETESKIPSVTD